MIVVQAFHPGDIDQSQRFAQWIKELGGCKGHKLLLIHDTRCEQTAVDQLRDLFAESFDSVELQDFTDHWNKWPESPCQVFQQAARYVEATNPQPWFFVEPDCVALRAGWLDEFAAEYERAGKSFLGDFVSVHTPQLDVPDHMSGNAIYPGRMSERAGLALIAHDIAFDVAAAQQILPQMHHSELLHHSWKCPGFADWSQFEREVLAFKPKCALFHADKTGSLYPLLRARMNLSGDTGATNKASAPTGSVSQCSGVAGDLILAGGSSTPPAQSRTCDIFIKTYPPDFVWLRYCLRSIAKFAHGFNRVVVVTPEPLPQDDPIWTLPQVFVVKEEAADGYLSQQLFKLNAHQFCQSDYILHTDSDTIFTEPVTPADFFEAHAGVTNDKGEIFPSWLITPYAGNKLTVPWREPTEAFLGEAITHEFMRRLPVVIPRWAYAGVAEFCHEKHGEHLASYIMRQPLRQFSEFNAIGAWLYRYHRDAIHWIDTDLVRESEWPRVVVDQQWSWGGWKEEIAEKWERILNNDIETRRLPARAADDTVHPVRDKLLSDDGSDLSALRAAPQASPWADKPATLARIRELARELKVYCGAPRLTAQTRDILREEKVIR
jgi:hypothetical protein